MALFEDFKKWLEINIPKSTKHYITGYNTINKLIEEYDLTLFNNLDINNIDDFIQNISEIDAYKKMNIKGSNMYSATLTNYKKFLMDQNLSIPIIEKPFEEFGWRWATTGIASYLNESKYLKTVLDAILINGNGLLNQTSDFKNLVETIGINKYKIETNKIDQISKKSNPSDSKNIIENSANYWYHLGLLESTGQNAKVSELGYNFLVGKLSNLEFVDHIINNYLIPSPIYKKNEIALFDQFHIKFKPLKIIVDILLYLETFDKEQAFLTENDLKNLIVPFSIKFTEENIKIFSSHLINFRYNPNLYNSLPDCTSHYTDDKGLRMLNEFLYFLECFEVLESNSTNVRSSDKKYYLNHNYKATILDTLENPELLVSEEENKNKEKSTNTIYYGAPGTGKSYKVDQIIKGLDKKFYERVTFHPEYDNASFIGGYKPISEKNEEGKDVIKYEFVPQAFANIYKRAWQDLDNQYYLVIEEINRGNCAEIFGELFQLLDRNSGYTVTPSNELYKHLVEEFGYENHEGIIKGLQLPPNLAILATMNTSDQSLFPMDSAFKRRWDWEYVPICYDEVNEEGGENKSYNFVIDLGNGSQYSWIKFIEYINLNHIKENPNLGMDKCIGNYFVKPEDGDSISLKQFINKVVFYLWNDVFKDEDNSVFEENSSYEDFFPITTNGLKKVTELFERIGLEKLDQNSEEQTTIDLAAEPQEPYGE